MRWDKIVIKTLNILNILPRKNLGNQCNIGRPKCNIGFVGCKSVKMCVLDKLPDMSSNSANIDKDRIN